MGAIREAVDRNDPEAMLTAMITALADELDKGVPARELASVTKRLMELHKERESLLAAKAQAAAERSGAEAEDF